MQYGQIPKEVEDCINFILKQINEELERWKETEHGGVIFGLEIAKAIVVGYYEGLKKAYGV